MPQAFDPIVSQAALDLVEVLVAALVAALSLATHAAYRYLKAHTAPQTMAAVDQAIQLARQVVPMELKQVDAAQYANQLAATAARIAQAHGVKVGPEAIKAAVLAGEKLGETAVGGNA